ncbi:4Fe-4S dicluster domain-containing protein [Chloroflexota bacterium]
MSQGNSRREFIKKVVAVSGLLALPAPLVLLAKRGQESVTDNKNTPAKKVHAWCMVIDLKKCDGCVSNGTPPQCTEICIKGHYSPNGQQWIEVYREELPGDGSYFLPTPCYQCENAPCVNVCPVAATYHTRDGIVLIDNKRCIGCRLCMAACPYHRRFFNWGEPQLPPEATLFEHESVVESALKGTVSKCMFCAHLLAEKRLPYCVLACPQRALYMGELNEGIASNGKEIVKLSEFLAENDSYRYKEELGTMPRVFYLPGHGQEAGRKANDPRPLKPVIWPWGG